MSASLLARTPCRDVVGFLGSRASVADRFWPVRDGVLRGRRHSRRSFNRPRILAMRQTDARSRQTPPDRTNGVAVIPGVSLHDTIASVFISRFRCVFDIASFRLIQEAHPASGGTELCSSGARFHRPTDVTVVLCVRSIGEMSCASIHRVTWGRRRQGRPEVCACQPVPS
jgi:hypothetical protein